MKKQNIIIIIIILHGANYTATYHLSRKLYKLDELDMPDTAGEAKTRS